MRHLTLFLILLFVASAATAQEVDTLYYQPETPYVLVPAEAETPPPAPPPRPATIPIQVVADSVQAAHEAGLTAIDPCLADTLVYDIRETPAVDLPYEVDLLGSGCVVDVRPTYYSYLDSTDAPLFQVHRPAGQGGGRFIVTGLHVLQPAPSADTTVVRCNPSKIKDGGSWGRLTRCMGMRYTWNILRRGGSSVTFEDYSCVGAGCNGPLRGSSVRSDTLRDFHVQSYGAVVYSSSCGGGSNVKDSVYAYLDNATIEGFEPPEWESARQQAARPQRHLMYASSCVGFDIHNSRFGPMPYKDLHRDEWGSRGIMRTHGSQTKATSVEQHFWNATMVGPGLILNSPIMTTHWHDSHFRSTEGERRLTFNIPGDAYVDGGDGIRTHFTFKAWGSRNRSRIAEIMNFRCVDCSFEQEATGGPPLFRMTNVTLTNPSIRLNQSSGRVEIYDSHLIAQSGVMGSRNTPVEPVLLSGTLVESQGSPFSGHVADFGVRLDRGARVMAAENLVERPGRVTVTLYLEPGTRACTHDEYDDNPDGCAVVAASFDGVEFVAPGE